MLQAWLVLSSFSRMWSLKYERLSRSHRRSLQVVTVSCLPTCPCALWISVVFVKEVVTSPVTLHVAGFMTYIVEPLFREWARFTGNSTLSENMLSHLAHNKAQWKSLLSKQHRRRGSGQDSAAPTSETLEQTEGATP